MNIVVISASMRPESQSLKISNWLSEHLKSLDVESSVLDLNTTTLPMFEPGTSPENKSKVLHTLNSADGLVFVSPEWDGTMSYGLVNMLHYVGNELAHKPVMMTGVSSGRGGHYPLMQMRIMGYKNNHFAISPEALLVQDCKNMLNNHDMSEDQNDIFLKKRADYALKILVEYTRALQAVRDSGVVDHENFPNGV